MNNEKLEAIKERLEKLSEQHLVFKGNRTPEYLSGYDQGYQAMAKSILQDIREALVPDCPEGKNVNHQYLVNYAFLQGARTGRCFMTFELKEIDRKTVEMIDERLTQLTGCDCIMTSMMYLGEVDPDV